jgi:hypothetical protein
MIIARELRKQNIAEYLIYMFQLEDLIRAYKADIDLLYENHIRYFQVEEKTMKEMIDWYKTFCKMMKEENVLEKGHLQFIKNKISELESFHYTLLASNEQNEYIQKYQLCKEDLTAFKAKAQLQECGDVEIALTALYMILLLRLKKKNISQETSEAVNRISNWISLLAKNYHKFENGEKEFY